MTCGQLTLAFCSSPPRRLNRLALCELVLSAEKTPPAWVQLVPAGDRIKALDGREFGNPKPEAVIAAFNADPRKIPIDWEHATEIKAPEGEPAPAAGWITAMEVRDGAVWSRCEWTGKGAASLTSSEYKYLSPAFIHDKSGVIAKIISAALTNRPAFDMPELAHDADNPSDLSLAQWTAAEINNLPDSCFLLVEKGGTKDDTGKTTPRSLRHFPYKGADGIIDLPHLRNAISRIPQAKISGFSPGDMASLQEKARKLLDKVQANASARIEDIMDKKLLELLGLAADATVDQVVEAVAKLKDTSTKAAAELKTSQDALATARASNPTLDKFVPRADLELALARATAAEKLIADEKKAAHVKAVTDAVEEAVKAGKVTPASKEFYLSICSDEAGLKKFKTLFVPNAVAITEPSDLDGKKPPIPAGGVTPDDGQLAIARACGMTPDELKKQLAEMAAERPAA